MNKIIRLWQRGCLGKIIVGGGALLILSVLVSLVSPKPAQPQAAPAADIAPAVAQTTAPVAAEAVTEAPPAVTPEYARLAAPDPTQAPVATDAPAAATAAPQAAAPDDASYPCTAGQFKGNDKSHIFHAPGQRDYAKTRARVTCFDTAAQATAAGYRAAKR